MLTSIGQNIEVAHFRNVSKMAVEECTALRAELTSFQDQVRHKPSLKARNK